MKRMPTLLLLGTILLMLSCVSKVSSDYAGYLFAYFEGGGYPTNKNCCVLL